MNGLEFTHHLLKQRRNIMQNKSEKSYMTTEEIDATIAEQDAEQEKEEKDDLLELLGF